MFKKIIASITLSFTISILSTSIPAQAFTDTNDHWAKDYIDNLYTEGIVQGKGDDFFDPDSPITRAELIKITHHSFINPVTPTISSSVATIKTNYGDIVFYFRFKQAPENSKNFWELAKADMYDGNIFHRVIDGFMIQGGDIENQNGTGGYSYLGPETIVPDEFNTGLEHVYGAVSMANAGPNTGGSQFFIVQDPEGTPWLDGHHSVFGQVVEGMEVVDAIAAVETNNMEKPIEDVIIEDIVLADIPGYMEKPFVDVEGGEWYAPYLEIAKENGIIDGYDNGEFRPNQPVSRVEALKIIMESADVKLLDLIPQNFNDASPAAWYADYINNAWEMEIISGYDGNLFKPYNNITRAEAVKIVSLLLEEK
ncbi:peptidylprolyl isomerase [Patescibacteria group bacterium]